jgi:hypothetical protein
MSEQTEIENSWDKVSSAHGRLIADLEALRVSLTRADVMIDQETINEDLQSRLADSAESCDLIVSHAEALKNLVSDLQEQVATCVASTPSGPK